MPSALREAVYRWALAPTVFVREALGVEPDDWQCEFLDAVRDNNRVAVRSGHGVGKTAALSWLIIWWLLTRTPCKVICTAPTKDQLYDVLWMEVALWMKRLPDAFRSFLEWKSDRINGVGEFRELNFAIARTARRETPEALQGHHSPNQLIIVDEASGVDDVIFQTGAGSMSTAGAKTVLTGNPTRNRGYFFEAHTSSPMWRRMRVSSRDAKMASAEFCDDIMREYGETHPQYKIRVLGEFAGDDEMQVIPWDDANDALGRDVEPIPGVFPVWALDVARSITGDRSALAKRQGNIQLEPVKWWRGKNTVQLVGLVVEEWRRQEREDPALLPSEIIVDAIGYGAGVADLLQEQGLPARALNVSETALRDEEFVRMRDQLWFDAADWLATRAVKLCDPELVHELILPHYYFSSNGRRCVEKTEEIKRDNKGRSPDLASAWVMTFAGGYDRDLSEVLPDRYAIGRARMRHGRQGSWMSV